MFELKNNKYTAKDYIENFLWIANKDRQTVPFKFNNIQSKLYFNMGLRNNVLKYRKGGISSEILALWLIACMFEDNARAVVVSHEKESTQRLFDRVLFYIDNLAIKPKMNRESVSELSFTDTRSSFYIGTAGARAFGRGDDITHLLCSEIDWWENHDILTGLYEACVPKAYIVNETTANGFNSYFHKRWKLSRDGDLDYTNHFFGWNESEENTLPIESGTKLIYTAEEKELVENYNLTIEQINWKRFKLSTMDKPELFPQEFPINDVEAFMFTDKNYFNTLRLKQYLDSSFNPVAQGKLSIEDDRVIFTPDLKGYLKIYRKPETDKIYAIGADTAEGIGQNKNTATIMSRDDHDIVASYRADISPSEFGRELAKLGKYYNYALIAPEVNNHGFTTITVLNENEKYKNIYKRTQLDKATKRQTEQLGWKTTDVSRPIMLGQLDRAIREGLIGIPCKEIIEQLLAFVINKDGKPEATGDGEDDFVISTAICNYVLGDARSYNYENRGAVDYSQKQFDSSKKMLDRNRRN